MANILIIDEDRMEAAMEETILQLEGHDVRVERDGVAALASIRSGWPTVVVLDPNHEVGAHAVHQARLGPGGKPTAALLLISNAHEGASLGGETLADAQLAHPFSGAQLASRVASLLEN